MLLVCYVASIAVSCLSCNHRKFSLFTFLIDITLILPPKHSLWYIVQTAFISFAKIHSLIKAFQKKELFDLTFQMNIVQSAFISFAKIHSLTKVFQMKELFDLTFQRNIVQSLFSSYYSFYPPFLIYISFLFHFYFLFIIFMF